MIQRDIGLGVEIVERLGQPLFQLQENQPAQFGGEVVAGEQLHEGVDRDVRTQWIGFRRLPRQTQRGGKRIQTVVQQLQRVHQLVFQQLHDLLAGQMDFELRLRHQAHALVVDRARARVAPAVERVLECVAVAVGQFQRALVEQTDRDAVVVDGAVVVAGDGGQTHLFFDIPPETREHARQRRHRIATNGFEDFFGALARQWRAARKKPAVIVHTDRLGGEISGGISGENEPSGITRMVPDATIIQTVRDSL